MTIIMIIIFCILLCIDNYYTYRLLKLGFEGNPILRFINKLSNPTATITIKSLFIFIFGLFLAITNIIAFNVVIVILILFYLFLFYHNYTFFEELKRSSHDS